LGPHVTARFEPTRSHPVSISVQALAVAGVAGVHRGGAGRSGRIAVLVVHAAAAVGAGCLAFGAHHPLHAPNHSPLWTPDQQPTLRVDTEAAATAALAHLGAPS